MKKQPQKTDPDKMKKLYMRNWIIALVALALAVLFRLFLG